MSRAAGAKNILERGMVGRGKVLQMGPKVKCGWWVNSSWTCAPAAGTGRWQFPNSFDQAGRHAYMQAGMQALCSRSWVSRCSQGSRHRKTKLTLVVVQLESKFLDSWKLIVKSRNNFPNMSPEGKPVVSPIWHFLTAPPPPSCIKGRGQNFAQRSKVGMGLWGRKTVMGAVFVKVCST